MNKKLISAFMLGLLALGTAGTITSCKDYDGDISSLKDANTKLTQQIATLQSALDQAKADANTAHATFALKSDLEALKTEVAKLVTAAQLEAAIADCKAALQGGYSGTMKDLANSIDGIDSRLNTLESTLNDPETGLAAAHKNIQAQKDALEAYKKEVEALLGKKVDQATYDAEVKKINDAISALEQKDKDLQADIDQLKKDMQSAQNSVNAVSANLNILTVFVNSRLTSLVLRPDMYYGGIESVKIFNVKTPVEKANDEYHYFTRVKEISLPSIGLANYHINPATAKLNNTDSINFYSWVADINVPATVEASRAGDGNKGYVWAPYNTYADVIKNQEQENAPSVITVPFKANIDAVEKALAASQGVIMALQYRQSVSEKKDTTITSDYALVVPKQAYQLLVCDNSFVDADGVEDHNDIITTDAANVENGTIRVDGDKADNNHLHRSFDYLAKSNVPATHDVYYQGSIDITALLATHCINNVEVAIKDTAVIEPHKGSWKMKQADGCATVDKKYCDILTANDLKALGLHYEIHTVAYDLGSTGTDETAHIELITDEATGHVIAYPRSVTKDKGETIKGKVADVGAIGRMPILCIELIDEAGETVSFAYMKLLITDQAKQMETSFEVGDIYADCYEASGWIKWHQFEVQMFEEVAKIGKEDFDLKYTFDKYKSETEALKIDDVTKDINVKYGVQYTYNEKTKKYTKIEDTTSYIGEIMERANLTEGGIEDPTTHILGWYFNQEDYMALYEKLDKEGKLVLAADGLTYVNTEDIVTYVYYKPTNTKYTSGGIYVKMTIPAGKFHFAAGKLGNNKVLSYWYQRDTDKNAVAAEDAFEVRVNVPTPQLGTPGVRSTGDPRVLGPAACVDNTFAEGSWKGEMDVTDYVTFLHSTKIGDSKNPALATPQLTYYNDDVLEDYEFIKDLHDYFLGELSAAVLDTKNFPVLSKASFNPAFEFTVPQKDVNASFSAAADGSWVVEGVTGTKYTLKLNAAKNEVRIVKVGDVATNVILACLSNDNEDVQSVIKWHQNKYADDILNKSSHKQLGSLETATLYIKISTPEACAPIKFNESLFNVRFVRPVEMSKIPQQVKVDAPNSWQEISISGTAIDWRNYTMVENTNRGKNDGDYAGKFDRSYYQIAFLLNNAVGDIYTDANLGTGERDAAVKVGEMKDVNVDKDYLKKCIKATSIKGFELINNSPAIGEAGYGAKVVLKYKNNSGITGKFNLFIPVAMRYVFGQLVPQYQYVTVGINCSVDQPQAK